MKNTINITALFFLSLLIFSCTPPGTHDHDHDDDDDDLTLTTEDTISLQKFQTWVDNWDSLGQSYTATTLTQYFTLPLIDIEEFIENMETTGRDSVVAARFYLGLDISSTPTPHILLVGVNSLGDSLTNEADKQYIYDISKPCPNLCGLSSLPDKN